MTSSQAQSRSAGGNFVVVNGNNVPIKPDEYYHPGLALPDHPPVGTVHPAPFVLAEGMAPERHPGTTANSSMAVLAPRYIGKQAPTEWFGARGAALIMGQLHFVCRKMHTTRLGGEYTLWIGFNEKANGLPMTACKYCTRHTSKNKRTKEKKKLQMQNNDKGGARAGGYVGVN